jgi:drug/metabolite transporter (DMT)-like permease
VLSAQVLAVVLLAALLHAGWNVAPFGGGTGVLFLGERLGRRGWCSAVAIAAGAAILRMAR